MILHISDRPRQVAAKLGQRGGLESLKRALKLGLNNAGDIVERQVGQA